MLASKSLVVNMEIITKRRWEVILVETHRRLQRKSLYSIQRSLRVLFPGTANSIPSVPLKPDGIPEQRLIQIIKSASRSATNLTSILLKFSWRRCLRYVTICDYLSLKMH